MSSWFARGLAACSVSLALVACTFEDDDAHRSSPPPPAPAPSSTHGTASPSASATTPPPPPPASSGGGSSSGAVPPNGVGVCQPNAVCGGIDICSDGHYACGNGQTGTMSCVCDGAATTATSHLRCTIDC